MTTPTTKQDWEEFAQALRIGPHHLRKTLNVEKLRIEFLLSLASTEKKAIDRCSSAVTEAAHHELTHGDGTALGMSKAILAALRSHEEPTEEPTQ